MTTQRGSLNLPSRKQIHCVLEVLHGAPLSEGSREFGEVPIPIPLRRCRNFKKRGCNRSDILNAVLRFHGPPINTTSAPVDASCMAA